VLWHTSEAELLPVMVMSVLLVARHKDNITRLLTGQESKIGAKKEAPVEPTPDVNQPG
jgi:glycerol-3-phosphate acyltransferase PlsY